jgi:hypothetical protein
MLYSEPAPTSPFMQSTCCPFTSPYSIAPVHISPSFTLTSTIAYLMNQEHHLSTTTSEGSTSSNIEQYCCLCVISLAIYHEAAANHVQAGQLKMKPLSMRSLLALAQLKI